MIASARLRPFVRTARASRHVFTPGIMVATRSQQKNKLAMTASSTPPREMRTFKDVASLISFKELAALKPEHGTAVIQLALIVDISALEREVLERLLPALLTLTPNIIILTLWVYPPISTVSFARVPLPSLEVIRTNIPHRALRPFVAFHPTLRALDIDACGRARRCGLSTLNIHQVNDISCLVSCVPKLVHKDVERLRVALDDTDVLMSAAISAFPISLHRLHVLTVDFAANDKTILRVIATNMPGIRNLKLLERCKANRHAARPWTDATGWCAALKKLSQLDQLVVRTNGVLSTPDDRKAERELFHRWVGGKQLHSTLRYIAVWQRYNDRDRGVISEWSREDGNWKGKWTEAPVASGFAMFD
ncbi:hypothetical protein L226DRAFT_292460 [Lentinus tigrinus ALCF2SS1-7]|uniref:uncharacterized protein n=1 Tax=Lentinus tigrinus ALCF2SS1-7 TaxID=1328758 RepID=UPI0011660A0E|nr:hypothetical protein L226DRAFT_292460 [Lentinus tigrinus ALCF2SS1-7]